MSLSVRFSRNGGRFRENRTLRTGKRTFFTKLGIISRKPYVDVAGTAGMQCHRSITAPKSGVGVYLTIVALAREVCVLTHDTASVIDSVYFTPCRVSFGVSWRLSETERNETTRSIHYATTIKLEARPVPSSARALLVVCALPTRFRPPSTPAAKSPLRDLADARDHPGPASHQRPVHHRLRRQHQDGRRQGRAEEPGQAHHRAR